MKRFPLVSAVCAIVFCATPAITPLVAQHSLFPSFPKPLGAAKPADTSKATSNPADSTKSKAAQDTSQEDASNDSPRASLQRFFALANAEKYDSAAMYLEIPDSLKGQSATLAKHLKEVLDRDLWIDLSTVSANAEGDTTDGLPRIIEQLGTINNAQGIPQYVRLVRVTRDGQSYWRFSHWTVAHIAGWYNSLSDRWMLEHLPDFLLRTGPFNMLWWQWVALPILLLVAIIIGYAIGQFVQKVGRRITTRTRTQWDDELLVRLNAPFTVACTLIAIATLLPWLALYVPASHGMHHAIHIAFFVVIFWAIWRFVDVSHQMLVHTRWALTTPSSRALLPLAARVIKVLIFAVATAGVLSALDYPIASIIAGLGLGGLAFALAAQKTVENLFGAFSIGVDQPFREGDFVKVEDFTATVETIGLRSTRFRTLDRTIITIPNGRLADMRLESYAARDRMRLSAVLGLAYETTAQQMREVLEGFERVLREQPLIWPDSMTVRFKELAESSLNVEVMAWFRTADANQFQDIRQDVLLHFMDVVERAGTSFAFPTHTVHVVSDTRGPTSRASSASQDRPPSREPM